MEQSEFDAWRAAHPWGILDDVGFRNDSRIVVQAAGYGPVWQPAFIFDKTGQFRQRMLQTYPEDAADIGEKHKPVLRLVKDDVPLVGRVLDTKGQPISGVKISVAGIQPVKNEDLTDWLSTAQGKDASVVQLMKYTSIKRVRGGSFADGAISANVSPQIMPAATTDADGRVCLTGIGRERLAMLRIEGPGIESACLFLARTRPGPPLKMPHQIPWNPAEITFYGATFDDVARASVPITGTVRDKQSGKPLPGVTIQAHKLADSPVKNFVAAYYLRTTSDADGHYRLTGMPIGKGSELHAGDLLRMQAIRTAGITVNWNLGLKDVTGADLHLLLSSPFRFPTMTSNAPGGKKWVVTKTVQIDGKPTCWCIPVEVKKGKEVTLTLSETNTFDLDGTFQNAMKEDAE